MSDRRASMSDDAWPGWATTAPAGSAGPRLVRTHEDRFTRIRLQVFDPPPPPRVEDPDDRPLIPLVEMDTPRAAVAWFAGTPHPDSGYGAYDGRCGGCGGRRTICNALARRPIAPGIDEVIGEISCPGCGAVTRLSYDRDSR